MEMRRKHYHISLIMCTMMLLAGNLFGQQWQESTDVKYFKKEATELRIEYWNEKQQAETYALQNHILVTQKFNGGFYCS